MPLMELVLSYLSRPAKHVIVPVNLLIQCTTAAVLGIFFLAWLLEIPEQNFWPLSITALPIKLPPTASDILLQKLQEAVKLAGGVPGQQLSQEDRLAWEAKNPCQSRQEYVLLLNSRKRSETKSGRLGTKWEPILREYENLHRSCTRRTGFDVVEEFKLRRSTIKNSTAARCNFLVVEFVAGLGNRSLWLISNFLYAILTQRVLFIDTRTTMHKLFCEPFPGSSWKAPPEFPYGDAVGYQWLEGKYYLGHWDYYLHAQNATDEMGVQELLAPTSTNGDRIPQQPKIHKNADTHSSNRNMTDPSGLRGRETPPAPIFEAVRFSEGPKCRPFKRFFCNIEQKLLQRVPWVTLGRGCLYILPSLFAIPEFTTTLEDLFPDRTPLTPLLRYLTLPGDETWGRTKLVFNEYFANAESILGVQLRYSMYSQDFYYQLHGLVDERAMTCAIENGRLPSSEQLRIAHATSSLKTKKVVVFVTSLYGSFQSLLKKYYNISSGNQTHSSANNIANEIPAISVVQLSDDKVQKMDNYETDVQALVEIMSLSFSDTLLVTPISTFGSLAHSYGGLTPWLVNYGEVQGGNSSVPACLKNQAADPCYQHAAPEFVCPYEQGLSGKQVVDMIPYIRVCQDDPRGLQLVDNDSNSSREAQKAYPILPVH